MIEILMLGYKMIFITIKWCHGRRFFVFIVVSYEEKFV